MFLFCSCMARHVNTRPANDHRDIADSALRCAREKPTDAVIRNLLSDCRRIALIFQPHLDQHIDAKSPSKILWHDAARAVSDLSDRKG